MEKTIKINYHWNCNEGIEVPEKHKEALKEVAETRIFEMVKEDFNQGELITSIRLGKEIVPEEDEEDGLNYSGWWSYGEEKQ